VRLLQKRAARLTAVIKTSGPSDLVELDDTEEHWENKKQKVETPQEISDDEKCK